MRTLHCVFLVLLLTNAFSSWAQGTSGCSHSLALARTTYSSGRLNDVEGIIKPCLESNKGGFARAERVEAMKLLVLSYIFMEEPEKADSTMIQLLREDHFYRLNDLSEPAEYRALYKKFRSHMLFRVGIRFGVNNTYAVPYSTQFIANSDAGTYYASSGFQAGIIFEYDLSDKWSLSPEVSFSTKNYSYQNTNIFRPDNDNLPRSAFDANFNLMSIDYSLVAQYRLVSGSNKYYDKSIVPNAGLGLGVMNLLDASGLMSTYSGEAGYVINGAKELYSFNNTSYSVILSFGSRILLGSIYTTVDIRAQFGLTNLYVIDDGNTAIRLNYAAPLSEHRINSVSVQLGFLYAYFKPKKLVK